MDLRLPALAGLLLLAMLPTEGVAAEILKCVDANGRVTYTESQCPAGSEREIVRLHNVDGGEDTSNETVAEQRQQALIELEERRKQAQQRAQADREVEEQRQQRCEQARANQSKLAMARRMATGEGEDFRYLSEQELAERRRLNEQRLQQFCGD